MKKFMITLSAYSTMVVEANNSNEAVTKALENFEEGKDSLVFSIEQNGYEAEVDDDSTYEEFGDQEEDEEEE